jgi:thymidine kinase
MITLRETVLKGAEIPPTNTSRAFLDATLNIADVVYKLSGICSVCGEDATRTFRKLTASSTDQVLIGGKETYEPRCFQHWLEGEKEKKSWLS